METENKRGRILRRVGKGTAAFVPCVLLILWYIGVLGGNVREVEPGKFYRSAQLSHGTLARVLDDDHIRSVVNLRGAHPGEDAYDSERTLCQNRGIRHYDFSLSAHRLPPPKEIQGILAALDQAPRPILVHCKAGSDRTGLVSTLYADVFENQSLDQAEHDQLTLRYGHVKWSTGAMDRFFDLYRETSNGASLRTWIGSAYPAVYARQVALGASDVSAAPGHE